MKNDIKVSIICVTYNHKDFIKKCLEGFISQKTNFKFEAIIHDDCSIDGTKEIVEEYAKKYPEIIVPLFEKENRMQKEGCYNLNMELYSKCRGEYIAFCEGDDYWIDENKLQIQADFLDNNPDFTGCFHKSLRKNVITGEDICCKPSVEELNGKDVFTINDTAYGYFIETCSVMYRFNEILKKGLIQSFPKGIANGDSFLIYFFSLQGKIKYIDRLMSVKTINDSGVWNSVKQSADERNVKYWLEIINFPIEVRKLFDRFNCNLPYETPEGAARRVLNSALALKRFDIIEKAAENFPDVFSSLIKQPDDKSGEINYLKRKIKKYKKRNLALIIFCTILIVSLIISIVL